MESVSQSLHFSVTGESAVRNDASAVGYEIQHVLDMFCSCLIALNSSATLHLSLSLQSDECGDRRLRLLSACCACLTELVVSDMNGHQTVQNNGIYLVGLLILPQSTPGDNCARHVAVFDLQVRRSV